MSRRLGCAVGNRLWRRRSVQYQQSRLMNFRIVGERPARIVGYYIVYVGFRPFPSELRLNCDIKANACYRYPEIPADTAKDNKFMGAMTKGDWPPFESASSKTFWIIFLIWTKFSSVALIKLQTKNSTTASSRWRWITARLCSITATRWKVGRDFFRYDLRRLEKVILSSFLFFSFFVFCHYPAFFMSITLRVDFVSYSSRVKDRNITFTLMLLSFTDFYIKRRW